MSQWREWVVVTARGKHYTPHAQVEVRDTRTANRVLDVPYARQMDVVGFLDALRRFVIQQGSNCGVSRNGHRTQYPARDGGVALVVSPSNVPRWAESGGHKTGPTAARNQHSGERR